MAVNTILNWQHPLTEKDLECICPQAQIVKISELLRAEKMAIQQDGILVRTEESRESGISFCLSQSFKHKINELSDYVLSGKKTVEKFDSNSENLVLMKWENIQAKELFYNAKEKEHFERMKHLFEHEKFKQVKEKLKASGKRCGVTCVIHGAPGTGKTEMVYQLAKFSQRDVFMVDLSQINDMYVGESEKNLKRMLDKYQKLVEESDVEPILLFNEGDTMFGKRISVNHSNDEMCNNMKNILLQEMEQFKGIMIVTTNLTDNFDKAFERRFLYKMDISKPDRNTRSAIWKSMIPELSDT